jgi:hypothetical protein
MRRLVKPFQTIAKYSFIAAAAFFSDAGCALAESAKPTVITGTLVSVADRLPPFEMRGIQNTQDFTITLTGGNHVSESWRRAVHGPTSPKGKQLRGPDINRDLALGEAGAKVVWNVKGPHQLQQIMEGKQMIRIMDFSIDDANRCAVNVRFLLQQGHTDTIAPRFDNGQEAHFSLPRVESATCEIH